jgi:predicted PolB exonuclease-like 3'-5' exonuclease
LTGKSEQTMTSTTTQPETAYLVFDIESVPDGVLLARTKYRDENLAPEAAIARAQAEARETSPTGSDFLPVSFQVPVALCVARVATDFRLLALQCLDDQNGRPEEITKGFWKGLAHYKRARLVSFNGRGFDVPLMEMAAFRYGVAAPLHFAGGKGGARNRYGEQHLDLYDFITNFGACRMAGGLNLLAKLLGKPGKWDTTGDQVYELYRQNQLPTINAYCSYDVLDTYFVFLRTRVLTGELPFDREQEIVQETKAWLIQETARQPHLQRYLDNWGDWKPWI